MTELLQMLKKRKYSEKNIVISQCTLGVDKIIPTVLCFIQQPAAETVVTVQQGSTASDPTVTVQQRLWSQAALPVTLRTACSRDCGHRQQGSTASDYGDSLQQRLWSQAAREHCSVCDSLQQRLCVQHCVQMQQCLSQCSREFVSVRDSLCAECMVQFLPVTLRQPAAAHRQHCDPTTACSRDCGPQAAMEHASEYGVSLQQRLCTTEMCSQIVRLN